VLTHQVNLQPAPGWGGAAGLHTTIHAASPFVPPRGLHSHLACIKPVVRHTVALLPQKGRGFSARLKEPTARPYVSKWWRDKFSMSGQPLLWEGQAKACSVLCASLQPASP
jgi:hypothetical protein